MMQEMIRVFMDAVLGAFSAFLVSLVNWLQVTLGG